MIVPDFESDIVIRGRSATCSPDARPDVELVYFPEAWRGGDVALILRSASTPRPGERFVTEVVVSQHSIIYRAGNREYRVTMPGGTDLLDPQDVLEAWERTRDVRAGKGVATVAAELRRALQPEAEFFAFEDPIISEGHSATCARGQPADCAIAYQAEDWGGGNVAFTFLGASSPSPIGYFVERIVLFTHRIVYISGEMEYIVDLPNARFIPARAIIDAWDTSRPDREGKTLAETRAILRGALTL